MSSDFGRILFREHDLPRTVARSEAFLEAIVILQTAMRIRRDANVVTVSSAGLEDVKKVRG